MSEDPYLVQAVLIHFYIFRVNVKNFIRKVSHWAEVVHVLKDHVRWVIIQTKAITGNVIEHAFPNPRADGQVFATGPLICRKKHGAIFDSHLNTFFFSQADDGFHVSKNRGQLSSMLFVQSLPTNVFILVSPSSEVAAITDLMCSTAVVDSMASGESGFG